MNLKRNIPQKIANWVRKRRRSIAKYSIVPMCVVSLAFIMYKVIPEGKETDTEPQKFVATALKNIDGISIFAAVILYFMETGDRKQRKHYESWQVVDAAHGIKVSQARIQALEYLNEDGVSLKKLDLSWAELSNIVLKDTNLSVANLFNANLMGANLNGAYLVSTNLMGANLNSTYLFNANLVGANLTSANLTGANLTSANLFNANLTGASLFNANLFNANFTGANLMDAKLFYTQNLTPEQVKQAKNWEKAEYDEEFCAQLGLLSKPAE